MRAGFALFITLVGCGSAPGTASVTPVDVPRPDVVLVTIDTVRADRIGAYGYDLARTPTLDALAERGRRFEWAYSPYPLTIPSHASIMTGLYPPQHGVRDNGDNVLGSELDTLAEVLGAHGYATGASVAAFVTSRQWGLAQGFDAYFDDVPRATDFWHAARPGEHVVDDALGWVQSVDGDAPVFLWVHLYDAHTPREPVEPFATELAGRPYDAEIAYVDAQVARLVEAFDANTLFVVAADHGESMGEHNELTHGLFVYNATQRVPLILAGPGVASEVVAQPVSLVDVMPTVLDLVGVDAPEGLAGRPVPALQARPIYMESWGLANRLGLAPQVAIVDGGHKLIEQPRPELYGLADDPRERSDLASTRADLVVQLEDRLAAFGFEPPSAARDALSAETAEELAALGYLVGIRPDKPVEELEDPKDHLELIRKSQEADVRTAEGVDDAIATLRELVESYPEIAELRVRLSWFLVEQGKVKEAEQVITDGLAVVDAPELRYALVTPLLRQGRFGEAADELVGLRSVQEFSPRYRTSLLWALLAAGRPDEAESIARELLQTYPDDTEVLGILGVHLARTGHEAEAWPMLRRANEGERPPPDVAFVLGMRAAAQGDLAGSREWFAREVERYPFHVRARSLLASYARDTQDWEGWKEHTRQLTLIQPEEPEAWRDHAQARFNLKDFEGARGALTRALELAPKAPEIVALDANLLAKEGKREEGAKRFELARRLHEARQESLK